jgi:hypothetical protein
MPIFGILIPVSCPAVPDRKFDIKDNQLGIKLILMISTWDQVDPIFPVRSWTHGEMQTYALLFE